MVDGLGHGEDAERAGKTAVEYVAGHLSQPLAELFAGADKALRDSRGVAMGVAVIDEKAPSLMYAGIGNTRTMIVRRPGKGSCSTIRLSGNPGIVGGGYRVLTPETLPLAAGDVVILFTDGVKELVDLSRYDAALLDDVQCLADRILRDWRDKPDDATVLVLAV
jgi:hypothetical protein